MDLEKSNTLDRQDLQETMPDFQMAEPPSSGKPKRHVWLWVVILALLGLGVYSYYRTHAGGAKAVGDTAQMQGGRAGRGMGAVPVVAAAASKGNIGVYNTGLGAVIPIYTVTVKSQIAGYLMQVLYKEGQTVHKGDPLAEIDPRPYQVMLENAQAGLARDEANLENAKVDLTRYQTLVPLRAVPEQQLATQQALVKSDVGVVKTDQAQIDTAKLDLVYCHITAPITGRVGLRLVDPGNYVTPTDSTGLVVITQIQPITVIFTLAEDQLPAIHSKNACGGAIDSGSLGPGHEDKDSPRVFGNHRQSDRSDHRHGQIAREFRQPGRQLVSQPVRQRAILVEEKRGVTLIPTAAVQRNSQRTYVYLVKPDSTVTVRTITIGTQEGEETEVTSGLVRVIRW